MVENGNDRAGGVDARSIDTTASEPVDNSTIRDESPAQSVYSLIGMEADVFYIISKNVQISYEQEQQSTVLRGIPYVVLKGLTAAIYYPDPLRRTLGDIDIIVRPEDFSRTYNALVNAGYKTDDPEIGDSRHVHFTLNGVVIELHRRYAVLNEPKTRAKSGISSWSSLALSSKA